MKDAAKGTGFGGTVAAVVLSLLVAACATAPPADDPDAQASYREANDPIEPLNRYFFELNRGLDALLLRPVAEIYRGAVPDLVRQGVRNVLNNLEAPVTFANDLMQIEPERAGDTFGRFTTNTFVGVGGVFDVATGDNRSGKGGIPYHKEDFGQTLAVWGVPEGPYLVLPVFGPSPPRRLLGRIVDTVIDPVPRLVDEDQRTAFSITRTAVDAIDFRARNIETVDEIERSSLDFYATVRSLYRQRRAALIRNGAAAELDESPNINLEFEDDDKAERSTAPRTNE